MAAPVSRAICSKRRRSVIFSMNTAEMSCLRICLIKRATSCAEASDSVLSPWGARKRHAVVTPEILEGVVRGHHGTFTFWQICDHGADFHVQRFDLRDIGRTVGLEDGRLHREGLHKRGGDIVDIGHRVIEALPGMRVERAMIMTMVIAVISMVALLMIIITVFRMFGVAVFVFVLLVVVMAVLVMIVFVMRSFVPAL